MLPYKWGGMPKRKTITIAHITDCPTITVHAGKHYKALIETEQYPWCRAKTEQYTWCRAETEQYPWCRAKTEQYWW